MTYLVSKTSSKLFLLLLIKAAILAFVIAFYQIELSPDEAQYWTWSRVLDWGYYSKPPGIAWQIWGSTRFLGDTVLGVRLGALLIGFFLAWAVYYLALCCRLNDKIAFWSGVAMAFSPLGVYLSLAATTDGGAILFLVLAIAVVAKGIHNSSVNYPLAGFWILLGGLFKWTAFVFWPVALVFLLFIPQMRKRGFLWGILISLIALLPPLYWNIGHEWATFKHIGGALGNKPGGNFADFLGAQILLLSPVYFGLLATSYLFLARGGKRALLFCAVFPFLVLVYLGAAFFKKMQPNWAAYLYPPGMVLLAWASYPRLRMWLHIGTWVSILMVTLAFITPWAQQHIAIPYKLNPFRQSLGWEKIPEALKSAGYNPSTDFLMGDKYQIASLLSFYAPAQKRAYFFNISATRKNQFSYWPQMHENEVGKTGYFVVLENMTESAIPWYKQHYKMQLAPYFKSVSFVGAYPLYAVKGEAVKFALIFKCDGYLGIAPPSLEAY